MRLSKIALGLGFALAAVTAVNTASAAKFTLDYRHELRTDYRQNYDRICFIAAFDNGVGFYVDSSFKSWTSGGDNKYVPGGEYYEDGSWGDFTTNATEMSIWYGMKYGNFTVTPGLVTESTHTTTGYKPYLRLQYNTDFGLWFAIRPRFDYWRVEGTSADERNARIDAWVGYNSGNFGINYNYTYMWALNKDINGNPRNMYDHKEHNYEQNIAMNYRMGPWNPYVEIGDMANVAKDGRQARIRVGIQYSF